MKSPIHSRKSPGLGGVRVIRLTTGEARYQATVWKYLGTFETRAEAERAIREERLASYGDRTGDGDRTGERTVEG